MLTKIFLKTKLVLVICMLISNFWHQKRIWIIIDYFRANSSDLEYFGYHIQKLTYGAFFPLNFCHKTQFFNQNWKIKKNMDFWNSPCLSFTKRVVNFKNLHFLIFFNSDWKFVFYGNNWMGKMCHKSIFGYDIQIIPNQTSLRENNR